MGSVCTPDILIFMYRINKGLPPMELALHLIRKKWIFPIMFIMPVVYYIKLWNPLIQLRVQLKLSKITVYCPKSDLFKLAVSWKIGIEEKYNWSVKTFSSPWPVSKEYGVLNSKVLSSSFGVQYSTVAVVYMVCMMSVTCMAVWEEIFHMCPGTFYLATYSSAKIRNFG